MGELGGEEEEVGGRRWQSLSRLLVSQCLCRLNREFWRGLDVTCGPLGVATRSDSSPFPLSVFLFDFFFSAISLTSHFLLHKCTKK